MGLLSSPEPGVIGKPLVATAHPSGRVGRSAPDYQTSAVRMTLNLHIGYEQETRCTDPSPKIGPPLMSGPTSLTPTQPKPPRSHSTPQPSSSMSPFVKPSPVAPPTRNRPSAHPAPQNTWPAAGRSQRPIAQSPRHLPLNRSAQSLPAETEVRWSTARAIRSSWTGRARGR